MDIVFEDSRTKSEVLRTVGDYVPQIGSKIVFKGIVWKVNDVFTQYHQPVHSIVKVQKVVVTVLSLGSI